MLLNGLALAVAGWLLGWPEITALGAAASGLVLAVVATVSRGGHLGLALDSGALRVARGDAASVKVGVVGSGRRRALRLVEGDPAQPRRTVPVPRGSGAVFLDVPVSTATRGLHPLGPFTLVRGDPWSIWRTVVTTPCEGSLLVCPRTHPVRQNFASALRQGDSESLTRRYGEDHFFALRDYVLGDEPRNVHWRSSARSGRLVVRQKVAASAEGTLLVLDTDVTAYASIHAFSEGFVQERFEAAVEVMASLCVAKAADGQALHLATTSVHQPTVRQGSSTLAIIDALAVVVAVAPVDTNPAEIASLARRGRCSRLIIVTGTPSLDLLSAVRRCTSLTPVLVRVGGAATRAVPGVLTLDVADGLALS
jgi:uncharacterized protein (DUF58 family)